MKYKVKLEYRSYIKVEVDADSINDAIKKAIDKQPKYFRNDGKDVYDAEAEIITSEQTTFSENETVD